MPVDIDCAPDVVDDEDSKAATEEPEEARSSSPARRATALGVAVVVVVSALAGWLWYRSYQLHQAHDQRELYVQVAKQGAVNLTTIDWQRADLDVQRILDGATGQFHDEFAQRAEPFVELVRHAQSKTVGTVTAAGLESETADAAEVLVAVSVTTTNAGTPEPAPRGWRMRISVQRVGDQAKVSNVGFVP